MSIEIDNGWLHIVEEALELDIRRPFNPIRIPEEVAATTLLPEGHELKQNGDDLFIAFDGAPAGEFLSFHPNGQPKARCFYQRTKTGYSVLHGPCDRFDPNGRRVAFCAYVDGLKEGRDERFYDSGALYAETLYRNGALHGEQRYYHENGKVKTVLRYVNGKLSTNALLFGRNGELKREVAVE